MQNGTLADQHNDIYSDAEVYNIANPLQHKGKGRPANKRYLSAIENHSSKNGDIQEKTSVEKKEIRDNVLFVNHGIMIHEIALKRMNVIKRMFSPCIMAPFGRQNIKYHEIFIIKF